MLGFRIDDRELVLDPSCTAAMAAGSLSPSLSLKVRVSDSVLSAVLVVGSIDCVDSVEA
jgi:hypothetical protein